MKKKIDAIVVGELNVDLILNRIEGFPEVGKEKLAGEMTLTLGSSSAICASNLSSLGSKVSFLGKIGKDIFGDLVVESLAASKVQTDLIICDENTKTGATIVLNYDEDRAMITHTGAMETLAITDIRPEKIESARHLHFSSYFLQAGLRADIIELFRMAKQSGLTTSLDAQWDPAEKWDHLKDIRLLLAEDNMINQQVAVEILEDAGFKVDVANNGKEALKAVEKKSYSLILMDIQMPEMDVH